MVGVGFCQLVQDPVIFNGAGRDAFVARLIDHTLTWVSGWQRKAQKQKRLPESRIRRERKVLRVQPPVSRWCGVEVRIVVQVFGRK